MTADNSRAFFASVLLHGLVLAIALWFSFTVAQEQAKKSPKVIELVAGDGDNFRATEAPLLGVPGGVKIDIPKTTPTPMVAEAPRPEPVRPEPPKPVTPKAEPTTTPLTPPTKAQPTPVPPAPTKAPAKERTFMQNIRRQMIIGELKAKKQVQKERADEAKRLSKEEFDRQQKSKVASAKSPNQKVDKISTEGITGGVVGGSKNNTKGGAGGNALSVAEQDEVASYGAFLNQKLTEELMSVAGLDEGLSAEAEFEILSNGRLTRGRIVRSSRNDRFDSAVRHAIAAVRMPEGPPKGFDRVQTVTFRSQPKN